MIPLVGAHDFPYLFSDQAASLFNLPLTWAPQSHDALGVFNISTLWDWPYALLYGLAGKIGLNFTLSTFLFGIFPVFIIGWLTMGKLLKSYSLSSNARFVGQLLFVANSYILMLIDGGQLSLAIAYSFLPAVIFYLPSRMKFVLLSLVISFLDIRYLYLVLLVIIPYIIINPSRFKNYLITGLVTGLVLVGAHSYWLVPSLFSRSPSLPPTYTRPSQVNEFSFASLTHSLFLIHPHWPKNIFGQILPPSPYFFLLPILAFLPLVAVPRDRRVAHWIFLALLSVFLVKGSQPPFTQVYPWLFSHLPWFFLFRDPTKFFPLLALSYSVLFAYSCQYLFRNFQWLTFLIIAYLIILISPILIGQGTGLFSLPRNSNSYLQLARYLQSDLNPGGIVWIPSKPPLGFSSPIHPSTDALTLLDRRPFAVGVVGNYELLNFLRDASVSGQLLSAAGVRYVGISAPDSKRDSQKPEDLKYREIFTNQLSKLPWIKSRTDFGPVTLLETQTHQDKFFLPTNTLFIVGSDDIYRSGISLTQNALVFVEEKPGILSQISQFPSARLVLNHKRQIDAAAALIPASKLIFPSRNLNFSPDRSGWWKRETADFVSWRDFLQQKYDIDNQDFDYGGGWAVSEGQHILTLKHDECATNCVLLVRVMISPKGRSLNFLSQNMKIGEISTIDSHPQKFNSYDQGNFFWFEVGQIDSSDTITISTQGQINVVNALAVLPRDLWEKMQSDANTLLNLPTPTTNSQPQISYFKHDPTHYTVTIKNLSGPGTLAFSQNFDSFWRLNGRLPVPLYSFINGFPIAGSGEYDIYFTPQKYVWMQWIWDKISKTK